MKKITQKVLAYLLSIVILTTMMFGLSFEAMAAVTAPKVTATNMSCTSVKLSWKKISSAKKYTIYRSTKKTSGYKAIKTTSNNSTISYTNTGLTCNKTYYYKVTAINGKTKKTSSIVTIKVLPAKVGNVKASSPKCKQAKVSFSKVSGASGYTIYTSADNKTYKAAKTTTANSYTAAVGAGKSIYFKVRAYKTISSKKIYGAYSSAVKGTSAHSYATSTKAPTCTQAGTTTYTCSVCKYSYKKAGAAATGHSYTSVVTPPTENEEGYTTYTCKKCNYTYKDDITPATSHAFTNDYKNYKIENGQLYGYCTNHDHYAIADTLCIDISSLDTFEIEGVAKYNDESKKMTIVCDSVKKFEISGERKDLTISIDAIKNGEVKLNGVCISNSTDEDCIRINNKCTDVDELGAKIVPTVEISAKDGTTNSLSVDVEGGKGIQSEPKLSLKGHGTLNINTASSCITSDSKVYIKNLTLNLTSTINRGIDTKYSITDADGLTEEGYANMEIGANANIIINATKDGIRCKNLEFVKIDSEKNPDDKGSYVEISSGEDAIQLEGKTGLLMNSGTLIIKSGGLKLKKDKDGAQVVINTPAVFNKQN